VMVDGKHVLPGGPARTQDACSTATTAQYGGIGRIFHRACSHAGDHARVLREVIQR